MYSRAHSGSLFMTPHWINTYGGFQGIRPIKMFCVEADKSDMNIVQKKIKVTWSLCTLHRQIKVTWSSQFLQSWCSPEERGHPCFHPGKTIKSNRWCRKRNMRSAYKVCQTFLYTAHPPPPQVSSIKQALSNINPIHARVFLVLLFKIHVAPRKNFIRWIFFEKS